MGLGLGAGARRCASPSKRNAGGVMKQRPRRPPRGLEHAGGREAVGLVATRAVLRQGGMTRRVQIWRAELVTANGQRNVAATHRSQKHLLPPCAHTQPRMHARGRARAVTWGETLAPPLGEVMPGGQVVVLKVLMTSKMPPYMAALPQLRLGGRDGPRGRPIVEEGGGFAGRNMMRRRAAAPRARVRHGGQQPACERARAL